MPSKRTGRPIGRALLAVGGKLSMQVLNEFTAVARRKQSKDWREIEFEDD
jgi:predicted nucleic acid-binding protein